MIDLSTERWMQLVREADYGARRPELDPDDLRALTGRLYNVAPPSDVQKRNACHALRTTAQWFAWADPLNRVRLSRALGILAEEARRLLDPPTDPSEAAAAALPAAEPEPEEAPPVWTRRADLA